MVPGQGASQAADIQGRSMPRWGEGIHDSYNIIHGHISFFGVWVRWDGIHGCGMDAKRYEDFWRVALIDELMR